MDKKIIKHWIERALPHDAANVKRWFVIKSETTIDGVSVCILRRILGWDDSPPPDWVCNSATGCMKVDVEELNQESAQELIRSLAERPLGSSISTAESRKVELPVSDWLQVASTDMWSLRVPSIMYEIWPLVSHYELALIQWKKLNDIERQVSGIHHPGWLGATIVFLPQRRLYFISDPELSSYLVLPDPQDEWNELTAISEVLDGEICISRSIKKLHVEPWRELEPAESIHHLKIRYVTSDFSSMNSLDLERCPDAIAALPRNAHGHSGSDWRITVISQDAYDTVKIGLMRGIGGGYFTNEPWRDRLPEIGFSAPADAQYIPPSEEAVAAGYRTLLKAKAPVWICDPYADPAALVPLEKILYGGRLLTKRGRLRPNLLTEEWAKRCGIEVRMRADLHDRLIIGSQHAFLLGTSLNGLGKSHSFLVHLNATMRASVCDMFEQLWAEAESPTSPW